MTISLALTGTLWLAALALIVATRGRLGLAPAAEDAPPARDVQPRIHAHV